MNRKTSEKEVPCPICGCRICDARGIPEQMDIDLEIQLICRKCGQVWLSAKYLKKNLISR